MPKWNVVDIYGAKHQIEATSWHVDEHQNLIFDRRTEVTQQTGITSTQTRYEYKTVAAFKNWTTVKLVEEPDEDRAE